VSRINLWSRSLPRIELDQRSRDARLRLQHLERLLVSHAAARQYRRRWLPFFGARRYTCLLQERSVRGPLSDQRPSCLPAIGFGGSRIVAQLR